MTSKISQPGETQTGMVTTQAETMRTAEARRVAPTPMIEGEVTWVVETGTPR